jgi:hypothetical protein
MKALLLLLACVSVCFAEQTIEMFHPVTAQEARTDARRESYPALRAWHGTREFFTAGHPKELRFDLNGDGRPEVFLLCAGHSYWGGYSVFTRGPSGWIFIGGVGYGGHQPARSAKRRDGWHDFWIDTDGSRDSMLRTFYRWDATEKAYIEHSSRQIRPMYSRER